MCTLNTQSIDDWLHSTAVRMAENNRPMYNAYPCETHCMLIYEEKCILYLIFMVILNMIVGLDDNSLQADSQPKNLS